MSFIPQFYIGGVPNKQEGLLVSQNFTGCIENLYFNSSNINEVVKSVYHSGNDWAMKIYQKVNVFDICPVLIALHYSQKTELERGSI